MASKKKPRHGGVSKRNRGGKGNPLFGENLVETSFGKLPNGATFSLNGEACGGGLFTKIPPPKKYEGHPLPHNARRRAYGNSTIHFGSDIKVWTTRKELGKSKEIYEETLKRG